MTFRGDFPTALPALLPCLAAVLVAGCANFRRLGEDLKFIEETSIVIARVDHNSTRAKVYGLVAEWDREDNKVLSADFATVGPVGIFFLDKYDPNRIPVLFVYGAAGSAQDWRSFFDKIDRRKYQPWFSHYPTGRDLAESGSSLNRSVMLLQSYYGFRKIHVVAHSMGGLVSRDFILKNLDEGNRRTFRHLEGG